MKTRTTYEGASICGVKMRTKAEKEEEEKTAENRK